jgi:hypothetical protein
MVWLAETLADGLNFVRVDMYCVNQTQLFFGELTPGGGYERFGSRSAGDFLGSLWTMNKSGF